MNATADLSLGWHLADEIEARGGPPASMKADYMQAIGALRAAEVADDTGHGELGFWFVPLLQAAVAVLIGVATAVGVWTATKAGKAIVGTFDWIAPALMVAAVLVGAGYGSRFLRAVLPAPRRGRRR